MTDRIDNGPHGPIAPAAPAARRSRQARVIWGPRVVTVGGDAPVRMTGPALHVFDGAFEL